MQIYLNEVSGIADAIVSMMMSKRSWTRENEIAVRKLCDRVLDRHGQYYHYAGAYPTEESYERQKKAVEEYDQYMNTLVKWGWQHTTLLRFIDFSITVEGLHRAGQDDWDAHACRYNNRIIRSSTRLASFGNEMSEWYQNKIIPTDVALGILGINAPEVLVVDNIGYVKTTNGYIRADMKDNQDVKRGLYMLSIPSNFIFKVNLTDWSHVYKERNKDGHANPEVKQCCEAIADAIEKWQPKLNRELFKKIKC